MFKKVLAGAIALTAFVSSQFNVCGASIPRSEISLGGITVNQSPDFMKKIYGEPNHEEPFPEYGIHATYGKGVKIDYNNLSNEFVNKYIMNIDVTANNGWKTPAGIGVGDNISKALNLYGEPDYKKSNSIKTFYAYYPDGYSENKSSYGLFIVFNTSSGKILRMYLDGPGIYRMDEPVAVKDRPYINYYDNFLK